MTLTPDDIKRPAVIRLNRVINTLTGVVWAPLLVLAMTLYVTFKLVDDFSDSVRDASCDLRDYLLAAFVKRWPAPAPVITELLSDGRWHFGLDLISASEKRLKRGTIYVHLARLEDDGRIESRIAENNNDAGRREYRLSAGGECVAKFRSYSEQPRPITPRSCDIETGASE